MPIYKQDVYGGSDIDALHALNDNLSSYLVDLYCGTIYSVAKRTADKVSSIDLDLYNGDTEVESHPVLDWLKQPNPDMNQRQFLAYMQLYLDITGIVYLDMREFPIVRILPSQLMTADRQPTGQVNFFKYGDDEIRVDDLLVMTTENLHSPYNYQPGVSPVAALMGFANIENRLVQVLNRILRKQGMPSGLLSPDTESGGISEESQERVRRKYRQMTDSPGDVMVVDENFKFTPLDYKPTDLAVITISERVEQLICSAFGMPLAVLRGDVSSGGRAAMEAVQKEWADSSLNTRLKDLADFLTYQVLPKFDTNPNLYFEFDDPSPESKEQDAQIISTLIACGVWEINDGREYLGLDPISNAPVEPVDNQEQIIKTLKSDLPPLTIKALLKKHIKDENLIDELVNPLMEPDNFDEWKLLLRANMADMAIKPNAFSVPKEWKNKNLKKARTFEALVNKAVAKANSVEELLEEIELI